MFSYFCQLIDIKKILDMTMGLMSFEQQLKNYCKAAEKINKELMSKNYKDGFVLMRLNVQSHKIEEEFFNRSEHALASLRYSQYEQLLSKDEKWIITLLSTDAVGGLKEAYPNYFADSEIFLNYISYIKMAAELSKLEIKSKKTSLSI